MKKSGYGRAEPGIYMLVGGAGVPNYGDELIVSKWVDWSFGWPGSVRDAGCFPKW